MMKLEAGGILFVEGDPGDRMYIIRSGRVRILKRTGQHMRVLAELGPGNFFGEMSLLDNSPRSATVQALTECELAVVDQENLSHTLDKQPSWLTALIRVLASRVRETARRKDTEDLQRALPAMLTSLLAVGKETPAALSPDDVLSHTHLLCGLDPLPARRLLNMLVELRLIEWHEEQGREWLVIPSEMQLHRILEARFAREHGKVDPGWILSAGEQRILDCWIEAARTKGTLSGSWTRVAYGDFMDVLKQRTPGASLGVQALSRMEQNGIILMAPGREAVLGHYDEALGILESQQILSDLSQALTTLCENF